MDKEINQIKLLKTAAYLDTKDHDKVNEIICLYLLKMRQNNNIPGDAGHFLSTKIDSTDIRNENSTAKTRQKNHIF